MAKGQLRSNREAKKPKQNKPKDAPASSTSAQVKSGGFTGGKKK